MIGNGAWTFSPTTRSCSRNSFTKCASTRPARPTQNSAPSTSASASSRPHCRNSSRSDRGPKTRETEAISRRRSTARVLCTQCRQFAARARQEHQSDQRVAQHERELRRQAVRNDLRRRRVGGDKQTPPRLDG